MAEQHPVVHIVGTGTIGAPLIEICAELRHAFGIGVTFHKNRPLPHNRPEIAVMQQHGALLAVTKEAWNSFVEAGYKPDITAEDARAQASVVIDCTPKGGGRRHKELYYNGLVATGPLRRAIAQGSEKGFGIPYAHGINDAAITPDTNAVQVVSCNTHFGAVTAWAVVDGQLERNPTTCCSDAQPTCRRRRSIAWTSSSTRTPIPSTEHTRRQTWSGFSTRSA